MAGNSSWEQANRRQKLGLVWRIRKKISQIIKDYFHLPFFLLIILWPAALDTKGVGPWPTLAWPGWKQPDIPVEVDTERLETSRSEAGVLNKLNLAGIAKLSRLKYRWLRFVWPQPTIMDSELTIGWCKQPIPQSSMKYLELTQSA
jgi:hypothetical protein